MPKFRLLLVVFCLFCLAVSPALAQDVWGPDSYPPGINPLTGQAVADPFVLDRRPIIVKVSNFPPFVRPQSGIMDADIVWEHLLSGGVTRFSAIFLSRDVARVGPIRSLRLFDFELVRIYRALSVYSGMAQGTQDILRTDSLMSRRIVGGIDPCPALCRYPREGIALEHTLFGDTAALRELAEQRGRDVTPQPLSGMAFSAEPLRPGTPVNSLTIHYRQTDVKWEYDAESGRWLRSQDGEPHFADQNGELERISAANVVIAEEIHTIQPEVSPNYWGPGDFAFSVNFIGSGRIYFLRDGEYVRGTWRRATRAEPITYYDLNGELLTFKPGNTFFNLVPRWVDGYWLEFDSPNAPTAVLAGSLGQSMRTGPADSYPTPDVAYPGDTFTVIGRNNNGSWLQLRTIDNRIIWLPRIVLTFDESIIETLPRTRPANER